MKKTSAPMKLLITLSTLIIFNPPSAVNAQPQSEALKNYNEQIQKKVAKERAFSNKKGQIVDDEHKGRDAATAGDFTAAETYLKKAVAEAQELYGPAHFQTAWELEMLGDVYSSCDRPDDCEATYKKALVIFNSLDSNDREQIYGPADGIGYLLQGRGHYKPLSDGVYEDWLRRKHPDESARKALIERMDYIREHPFEKAKLDPAEWGTVPASSNPKLDQYLAQLRERIAKNWHAPGSAAPPEKAVLILMLSDGFNMDPDCRKSSGSSDFDAAAKNAIKAGFPYPPVPLDRPMNVQITFDAAGPGMPCEAFNY